MCTSGAADPMSKSPRGFSYLRPAWRASSASPPRRPASRARRESRPQTRRRRGWSSRNSGTRPARRPPPGGPRTPALRRAADRSPLSSTSAGGRPLRSVAAIGDAVGSRGLGAASAKYECAEPVHVLGGQEVAAVAELRVRRVGSPRPEIGDGVEQRLGGDAGAATRFGQQAHHGREIPAGAVACHRHACRVHVQLAARGPRPTGAPRTTPPPGWGSDARARGGSPR